MTVENGTEGPDASASEPRPQWIYLILYAIPLGTICGNVFVCLAVYLERRLRNRFNLFLVSLAVSDMLCATLVMPVSAWKLVFGSAAYFTANRELERVFCLIWYSLDIFFTATTIIHLCTISLDRYLALRMPLMRSAEHVWSSSFRLCGRIAIAWLISFFVAGPFFLIALLTDRINVQVEKEESYKGCGPNSKAFVITAVIVTFCLPLCIMFATYLLTIKTLSQQMQEACKAQLYATSRSPPSKSGSEKKRSIAISLSRKASRKSLDSSSDSNQRIRDNDASEPSLLRRAFTVRASPSTKMTSKINSNFVVPTIVLEDQNQKSSTPSTPIRDQVNQTQTVAKGRFRQAIEQVRTRNRSGHQLKQPPRAKKEMTAMQRFELWRIVREYKELMETEDRKLELEWAAQNSFDADDGQMELLSTPGHRGPAQSSGATTPSISPTKASMQSTPKRASSLVGQLQQYSRNRSQQKHAIDRIHKGRRAMQVIGVLFAVFVACYLPFFTVYLLSHLCDSCKDWTTRWISRIEWFGYIGSMLNPFVYHFFNPAFRRTFRRILHCQYPLRHKRNRHDYRAVWRAKK